jgi:hypothetical protein
MLIVTLILIQQRCVRSIRNLLHELPDERLQISHPHRGCSGQQFLLAFG